ncbi:hypothetical protein CRUP_015320 [Coryphaenoides rupestris]|nr:hypothetical protein CRUP_015320 [Coryphaenoides rupestris]
MERNGALEVEVVQARGLSMKPGSKGPPGSVTLVVWGNYGRMDRKCFMGMARILLEELDLSTMVVGWYKLFPTSSMVDPAMGPLMRHSSQMSLESTVGPAATAPKTHGSWCFYVTWRESTAMLERLV